MQKTEHEIAFVQTVYRRKRHIGYSVFVEWLSEDTGAKHGRLVRSFLTSECDNSADIALHLANTLRDDINSW